MTTFGPAAAALAAIEDDYEARVFQGVGDGKLNYRLLLPEKYDKAQKYPLVLLLHGAGERGDDNKAQLKHVAGAFTTKANREKHPCFVLVPQCPANGRWCEVHWGDKKHNMPDKPSKSLELTLEAIEQLKKEFSIDDKRLYVVGISMGGFGTWDAVSRHPKRFAAAVPICGGGDEVQAAKLVDVPIWAFHGAKDTAVNPDRTRAMIAAIKAAGGRPKYTEYPEVGHDSWTPAFAEAELLPWLFSQRLAK